MAIPERENITILKGATLVIVARFDTGVPVFKAISAITKAAPARITATAHGLTEGWPVTVVSAQGMTELNNLDPEDRTSFTLCSVVDADTIDLPFVNSSEYSTYTSGGYVKYYGAESLSGATASFQVHAVPGDEDPIIELDESDGIDVDDTNKLITVTIDNATTAALAIVQGVYALEIEIGGVVYRLLEGDVEVSERVIS